MKPPAAQPGSARPGPVGQAGRAVGVVAVDPAAHGRRVTAQQLGDGGRRPVLARQQDHDQAGADAVGAVQQPGHIARATGRAGGFGVHAGGTHTSGGLVGSAVLWKASATREATASALPSLPVTSRTFGHLLRKAGRDDAWNRDWIPGRSGLARATGPHHASQRTWCTPAPKRFRVERRTAWWLPSSPWR
jgi:hypothetical protein